MSDKWIKLSVSKDMAVFADNKEFGEDSLLEHNGKTTTIRNTPHAGLHAVTIDSDGEFLYKTSLCRPGTYYLGPDYGYRKVLPEEEPCKLKRLLREVGLPIDLIEYMSPDLPLILNRTSLKSEEMPKGTRYTYFVTDGDCSPLTESLGMQKISITKYNYAIELKEEMFCNEEDFATYNWIKKIYILDIEDQDLTEAAGKIAGIIKENEKYKELRSNGRKR